MGTYGQRTRIQHGIPPNVYMGGTMTGTKDTLVMPVVLVHDFIPSGYHPDSPTFP